MKRILDEKNAVLLAMYLKLTNLIGVIKHIFSAGVQVTFLFPKHTVLTFLTLTW